VEISTNGGGSWAQLVAPMSGTSSGFGGWAPQKTVNLNAYVGQTNVRIRFWFESDTSNTSYGAAVDDIALTAS
jgi:hypothetical protein